LPPKFFGGRIGREAEQHVGGDHLTIYAGVDPNLSRMRQQGCSESLSNSSDI
jgi:hypothetical protein